MFFYPTGFQGKHLVRHRLFLKVSQKAGLYLKVITPHSHLVSERSPNLYIYINVVGGCFAADCPILSVFTIPFFYRVLFGAIILFTIQYNLVTKTLRGFPQFENVANS